MAADDTKDTTAAEAAGTEPTAQDVGAMPAEQPETKAARPRRTSKPRSESTQTDAEAAAEKTAPEEKPADSAKAKTTQEPAAKAKSGAKTKTAAKAESAPKPKSASKSKAGSQPKPRAAATQRAEQEAPAAAPSRSATSPAKTTAAARPAKSQAQRPGLGPLEGTVVDAEGRALETIKLSAERFGVTPDIGVLHLVVRGEQASRRRGTASSKTRGEVSGTTAKMYRQKGTGRARAGSVKSPVRVGGGAAFGPQPRDHSIKVNRKVVAKALRMALSSRADAGNVFVARGITLSEPSTRAMDRMLIALDIAAPVLIVTNEEPAVSKSVRNLAYAESTEVRCLSTEQVLRARSLVFTEKAFSALDQA